MAHPLSRPIAAWLGLVALATTSLLAPKLLPLALAIAGAKAALVAWAFMRPVHKVVVTVALAFVALIVVGIVADVVTRPYASAYVEPDRS